MVAIRRARKTIRKLPITGGQSSVPLERPLGDARREIAIAKKAKFASYVSNSRANNRAVPSDRSSLWEREMASPQDFRDYAGECFEWAKTAKSDQERKIFRQMAMTWWNIARLTEEGRSLENLVDIFPVLVSTADSDSKETREQDVA